MPIESIHDDSVEQRCVACGATRSIALSHLELRIEPTSRRDVSPGKIALPVCASADCGACETLFASPAAADVAPIQGSYGHLHAVLVDRLAYRLLEAGRFIGCEHDEASKLIRAREQEVGLFFADGLVLSMTSSPSAA